MSLPGPALPLARLALVVAGLLAGACALAPARAAAHGLTGRGDLPIPAWLFAWAATLVLVVSFVALAALWVQPKLEQDGFRPLPARLGRALTSRPVKILCGAAGVFLLGLVVVSGLFGRQSPTANFAPTFVYVVFWIGLVPLSVLFGDVFRAFNPWRALGRATGWAARRVLRDGVPEPLRYPERLGYWPAAAGLLLFSVLELVVQGGDQPRVVAIAALAYTGVTLLGMGYYGERAWTERGEAFSVYFGLLARIAPLVRRGREIGLRPPLSGLAGVRPEPGLVVLVATLIGTVSFDGLSEGRLWSDVGGWLTHNLAALGLSSGTARELASLLGIVVLVLLVVALFRLAAGWAGDMARERRARSAEASARGLARSFAHSLVPIAFAYVIAHYISLLLFQGQAIWFLAQDPFGGRGGVPEIDYTVPAATIWYVQVGVVVVGHVAALMLAHDRALVLFPGRAAVRSQYPMLAAMIAFTGLALWLLSQANA